MNTEQKVYEIEETWSHNWFSESDKLRIIKLHELILRINPESLVDVGCGNGMLLNSLLENNILSSCKYIGVERSSSAIKHVKTEKMQASIDNIPISDDSYDLVTCCEVIEHLPYGVYEKGLKELVRISKKNILITVPYNENLEKSLNVCPYCNTKFNPEYHLRSFSRSKILTLFDDTGLKIIDTGFIEVEEYRWYRVLGIMKREKRPKPIAPHTICPSCGYNENEKLKFLAKETENETGRFKSLLKKIWPKTKRKRWIYGIYEKVK